MIPIKLQIKNFLSYGSDLQTIDFEPYNLICLSGKNGHGKSALLDAITWSIWGEARKSSGNAKADQGLLRLGQRQMIIIFDFEFNKNKYRVRREFTFAYGKPYAHLEFGIYDQEDKIISLTDKTIRATQEKIELMLGLNYDSFVNSAFLRQGNSNEFSRKSAKERKEILATILGLDKYEAIRKNALEKIKNISNQKESIIKFNEHLQKELSLYEQTKIDLMKVKEELEKISLEEKELAKKKSEIELEKSNYLSRSQEFKLLNLHLLKIKENNQTYINQLNNTYFDWKESHRKKILLNNYKDLEKQKKSLSKKIEEFQKILKLKLEYKEQLLKYKENEQILLKNLNDNFNQQVHYKKINLERLSTNKINSDEKLNLLENNLQGQSLNLKNVDNNLTQLTRQLKEIKDDLLLKYEKQFEKRRNFYQELIAQGNWIKSEINALEQKKKLSFDEDNPSCPLCEQNLSVSRKKFLKQKFSKQEKFYQHRFARISSLLAKLKEILLKQNEDIKLQKESVEQNKFLKLKIDELNNQKIKINNEINELISNKTKLTEQINSINSSILDETNQINLLVVQNNNAVEQNEEYTKLKLLINQTNEKLNEITYDQDEHENFVFQLNKIESLLIEYSNFNEIILLQDRRKYEINQLCLSIKKLKNEIKDLEQKLIIYDDLKTLENDLNVKENLFSQDLKTLSNRKDILLNQHGSLDNQKIKLEQLLVEQKNQNKIINQLDESIEEYKVISIALSKDGIQALLIEDSIPEIENEANELLSKLTDNQAQIFIESVRDLKKGGTKETLDIKISDGIGIRPYEMFSGGEAFRIDFALRIAISKLLARRAGTSLQTLIIDEGFGSQDEEGLTHIMDSIYKIQDDFAKIIIVSHLPSMKDQFPVHFFVEKDPAGSKVKVIEQG